MKHIAAGAVAASMSVLVVTTTAASAQSPSLVDVAARTAAARQAVTEPARPYTNADLKPVEPSVAAPASPAVIAQPALPERWDFEARRERGRFDFEQAVQILAAETDALEAAEDRYHAMCRGYTIVTALVNGRYVYNGPGFPFFTIANRSLPECRALESEIANLGDRIRTGMRDAVEAARQADVYPGTVRELRRKYEMDSPAWDH